METGAGFLESLMTGVDLATQVKWDLELSLAPSFWGLGVSRRQALCFESQSKVD